MARVGSGTGARSAEAVLLAAVLGLLCFAALARARVQPFWGWFYHFAWYATLLGLTAALALRERRWPLVRRPRFALSLFLWSVPVWLTFELINFRIANWYYVLATPDVWLRRAGTAAAFATVLPAIYVGHRWMDSVGLAERWRTPPFPVGTRVRAALVGLGLVFLALALAWPRYFFPLVWGSVTLLIEPWNHARDPGRSLLGDLSRGRPARVVRLVAAGAGIGLLWELFNATALTRWIYTVPWLERLKLFEMPLPGYLGFPVFALDCFVAYRALASLGVAVAGWDVDRGTAADAPASAARRGPERSGEAGLRPGRTAAAAVLAAGFSLAVLAGIDRWTVDSFAAPAAELPGATPAAARALAAAGLERPAELAAADPDSLAARTAIPRERAGALVRAAELASLRGIGVRNASALSAAGIGSVCELARAGPGRASAAVRRLRDDPRAGSLPRVRVWIRGARDACEDVERAEGVTRSGP